MNEATFSNYILFIVILGRAVPAHYDVGSRFFILNQAPFMNILCDDALRCILVYFEPTEWLIFRIVCLQWKKSISIIKIPFSSQLKFLAQLGRLKLLLWFYNQRPLSDNTLNCICYGATEGNQLEILKWAHSLCLWDAYTTLGVAMNTSNFPMIEWIIENIRTSIRNCKGSNLYKTYPRTVYILDGKSTRWDKSRTGAIGVYSLKYWEHPKIWAGQFLQQVVDVRNTSMINWMLENGANGSVKITRELMKDAEIMKLILRFKEVREKYKNDIDLLLFWAAIDGNFELIPLLETNSRSEICALVAAKTGNVELLQFVDTFRCVTGVYQVAQLYGHVKIQNWLVDNDIAATACNRWLEYILNFEEINLQKFNKLELYFVVFL